MESSIIKHPFGPVYNTDSRILILGTMASAGSRMANFYYGHKQNRFWPLIFALLNTSPLDAIEDKKRLLLDNYIALWDTLAECEITGSSDATIKKPVVNDFVPLLENSRITKIFTNGAKAHELYERHAMPKTGISAHKLPSTSPANASYSFERLMNEWAVILN